MKPILPTCNLSHTFFSIISLRGVFNTHKIHYKTGDSVLFVPRILCYYTQSTKANPMLLQCGWGFMFYASIVEGCPPCNTRGWQFGLKWKKILHIFQEVVIHFLDWPNLGLPARPVFTNMLWPALSLHERLYSQLWQVLMVVFKFSKGVLVNVLFDCLFEKLCRLHFIHVWLISSQWRCPLFFKWNLLLWSHIYSVSV